MKYSALANNKIIEIKKTILKKKIMLSIMIDTYSLWDKIYNYAHGLLAICSPLSSMMQIIIPDNSYQAVSVVFGIIVAIMIKTKEYLTFDKIITSSKEQTIKYSHLYDRIEREMIKPDDHRQSEEDFIYWVCRELSHLEYDDPELSYSDRKKYIAICKEKNIPYDDDIYQLEQLVKINIETDYHVDNMQANDKELNDKELKIEQIKNEDLNDKELKIDNISSLQNKDKFINKNELQWAIDRLNNL